MYAVGRREWNPVSRVCLGKWKRRGREGLGWDKGRQQAKGPALAVICKAMMMRLAIRVALFWGWVLEEQIRS
jgi:hypothetical protein